LTQKRQVWRIIFPNGNLRRLADHNLRKNAEVNRARKTFLKYGKNPKKSRLTPLWIPIVKMGFYTDF
jgi:hypothetical protein